MVDVAGLALTADERVRLRNPLVGGIILFSRNFHDLDQVRELVADIRSVRSPPLLVAVDQEGGRVQRFRDGFYPLPPLRWLGRKYDQDNDEGRRLARTCGWLMAAEVLDTGVDFSFAPVVDLDYGASGVIGNRSLHRDPEIVAELASAYILGMHKAGMVAVAKHFPGHGYATADSHVAVPTDDRPLKEILRKDVAPYGPAILAGLAGVMPAHVVYSSVDREPAGYSRLWLQEVLRGQLGFAGLIFSDDLSMEGAGTAGGIAARALAALDAGCDMVLLCNDPAGQDGLLDCLEERPVAVPERLERMRHRGGRDLRKSVAYREAQGAFVALA